MIGAYDKTVELKHWVSRIPPRKRRPVFDSVDEALSWMADAAAEGVMTVEDLMVRLRRMKKGA